MYIPNKETVQSLIRNILDGILTNPPLFSNKIFDIMLSDLSEVKDKMKDSDDLNKYLTSRYLKRIKETTFRKVFRSFWKVVFISNDHESNDNRKINYMALTILVNTNKFLCKELIKNEPDFYSNINNGEILTLLINFLRSLAFIIIAKQTRL